MPKRLENGYVALVIACVCMISIVGLVSFTVPYSKGYQAADKDHQAAYAEHNAAEEYHKECLGKNTVAEALECFQNADDASREKQAAEQDLDAQREMANWAEGMLWAAIIVGCLTVSITALGVYWVRDTLLATRDAVRAADDAVEATREIGEIQSRAYVLVDGFDFILNEEDQTRIAVEVHIKNHGITPAQNVVINSIVSFAESRAHGHELPVLDALPNQSVVNLAAGGSSKTRTYCPYTPETGKLAMDGSFSLFAYGEITYTDAFRKKRRTRYQYMRGKRGLDDGFEFLACEKGNYQD